MLRGLVPLLRGCHVEFISQKNVVFEWLCFVLTVVWSVVVSFAAGVGLTIIFSIGSSYGDDSHSATCSKCIHKYTILSNSRHMIYHCYYSSCMLLW